MASHTAGTPWKTRDVLEQTVKATRRLTLKSFARIARDTPTLPPTSATTQSETLLGLVTNSITKFIAER